MWPELAYYRRTGSGGSASLTNNVTSLYGTKASSYCPRRARLLAEMSDSEFDAYADLLIATGNTYLDIGILWGGRLTSPSGIFAENVNDEPDNGASVARHMIFMTDGEMNTGNTIQTSYGIEYHDRRVTSNGSSLQDERHTSRFLAVCEAVKAKGIRLWVIAFGTTLNTDLQTCSSEDSSFAAANASQLNTAFQEIANQVGELRVVQ